MLSKNNDVDRCLCILLGDVDGFRSFVAWVVPASSGQVNYGSPPASHVVTVVQRHDGYATLMMMMMISDDRPTKNCCPCRSSWTFQYTVCTSQHLNAHFQNSCNQCTFLWIFGMLNPKCGHLLSAARHERTPLSPSCCL